jgi:hypothetical protein
LKNFLKLVLFVVFIWFVGPKNIEKFLEKFFAPKEKYTKDWRKVSKEYRKSVGWKCEMCGVNCNTDNALLHTHHKNRNSRDNRRRNLIALCIQCHSQQPGKGHRWLMSASKKDGRWKRVDELRHKNSWRLW